MNKLFEFEETNEALIEWKGMPEYAVEDQTAWHQIKISFENQEDLDEFGKRLGLVVSKKTRYAWFPPHPLRKVNDLFYYDENADEHADSDNFSNGSSK